MNKLFAIIFTLFFIGLFHLNGFAQEKYGSTLNLGLGIGGYSDYYKYTERTLPVFNINYEGEDQVASPFENKYPEERFYNRTVIMDIIPAK